MSSKDRPPPAIVESLVMRISMRGWLGEGRMKEGLYIKEGSDRNHTHAAQPMTGSAIEELGRHACNDCAILNKCYWKATMNLEVLVREELGLSKAGQESAIYVLSYHVVIRIASLLAPCTPPRSRTSDLYLGMRKLCREERRDGVWRKSRYWGLAPLIPICHRHLGSHPKQQ